MKQAIRAIGLLVMSLCVAAVCTIPTAAQSITPAASAMPQFGHVIVVVGENSAYSSTYNSSNMPYLTSLANKYGLATKYWADTHPSIGNYEVFTAGQIFTNNDSQTPSSMPLSNDNIAFEVQQAGKTWKDYVETGNGCGALNSGSYIVRHDPFQYYVDINTEKANYVCFSQFATDLANHALPNLSYLAPNGCDDAHDCSLSTFDNWLKTELTPLLASSYFQAGGDGLLIITFDENDKSGSPNCSATTVGLGCGGQVETVLVSPLSKLAYRSTAGDPANFNGTYDGANILRTIADALGVNASGLGAAATRVPMADFFNTGSTGSVALSPTSLSFGNVTEGTSATQTVTLSNTTASAVSVSGIGIIPTTSGFTETNNCPASLGANSNCTITVTFAPTAAAAESATLSVTAGSTLTASLSGTGVALPDLTVSAGSLTFNYQIGGTAPAAQTVSVTSTGAALSYTVTTSTTSGGSWLSATPTSGSTPGSESVAVNTTGLAAGTYTGSVRIAATGAGNSPQTVAVTLNVTAATPNLTVSPATLTFNYQIGGTAPAAQTVSVGSTGAALSYTVTTSTTSGGSWLSASPASGSTPSSESVAVNTTGLAAGTYTGSVRIAATGAGNSPQTVAVTLNVTAAATPNLTVSPSTLTFNYQIGGTAPVAQAVSVGSTGASLSYTVTTSTTTGGNWLSATLASGTTPGSASVAVNTTGLAAGTYTGSVRIASTGAGNSPQTVAVTLNLTAAALPNLSVSPGTLTFNYQIGGTTPVAQAVSVGSTGASLSYTVTTSTTSGGSWLSATPASGTTTGNASVAVNTAGLAAGTYTGSVRIASTGAGNSPQTVAVTLTVTNPASGTLSVTPTSLSYSLPACTSDCGHVNKYLTVTSTGSPVKFTAAATGGSWLQVRFSTSPPLTTPGSVRVRVAQTRLKAGTYQGHVTISATNGNEVVVPVTLTVAAAPTDND